MTSVIYRIECPTCGAKQDQRCRTLRTNRSTDYHIARLNAWYRR